MAPERYILVGIAPEPSLSERARMSQPGRLAHSCSLGPPSRSNMSGPTTKDSLRPAARLSVAENSGQHACPHQEAPARAGAQPVLVHGPALSHGESLRDGW